MIDDAVPLHLVLSWVLHAQVYVRGGLIETVSRATSAIRTRGDVPLPDGASADSAQRPNGQ